MENEKLADRLKAKEVVNTCPDCKVNLISIKGMFFATQPKKYKVACPNCDYYKYQFEPYTFLEDTKSLKEQVLNENGVCNPYNIRKEVFNDMAMFDEITPETKKKLTEYLKTIYKDYKNPVEGMTEEQAKQFDLAMREQCKKIFE